MVAAPPAADSWFVGPGSNRCRLSSPEVPSRCCDDVVLFFQRTAGPACWGWDATFCGPVEVGGKLCSVLLVVYSSGLSRAGLWGWQSRSRPIFSFTSSLIPNLFCAQESRDGRVDSWRNFQANTKGKKEKKNRTFLRPPKVKMEQRE